MLIVINLFKCFDDDDDKGTIIAKERSVMPMPSTHLEIVIPRISN
jgi:hypothetical protein